MILVDFFGTIATITSIIGLAPQIYKTNKTKSAEDVSMGMLYNFLACSIAWIGYGIFTNTSFVVYSNIAGLITSSISIWQKMYYSSKA